MQPSVWTLKSHSPSKSEQTHSLYVSRASVNVHFNCHLTSDTKVVLFPAPPPPFRLFIQKGGAEEGSGNIAIPFPYPGGGVVNKETHFNVCNRITNSYVRVGDGVAICSIFVSGDLLGVRANSQRQEQKAAQFPNVPYACAMKTWSELRFYVLQ